MTPILVLESKLQWGDAQFIKLKFCWEVTLLDKDALLLLGFSTISCLSWVGSEIDFLGHIASTLSSGFSYV